MGGIAGDAYFFDDANARLTSAPLRFYPFLRHFLPLSTTTAAAATAKDKSDFALSASYAHPSVLHSWPSSLAPLPLGRGRSRGLAVCALPTAAQRWKGWGWFPSGERERERERERWWRGRWSREQEAMCKAFKWQRIAFCDNLINTFPDKN